jgi:uncharacterized protein (TIGR02266 family)
VTTKAAKSKHILLADDSAWLRDLNGLFLSRLGRVETAAGGREALELARVEPPDLIVTDLHMPDMSGIELCAAIRGSVLTEAIPILVLSGSQDPKDHERAIRAGATDILSKPIERPELLAAAQRLLTGTSPRGLPRIQIEAPARLRAAGHEWKGVIRNLSRGGVFIESERAAAPDSELELDLDLPDVGRSVVSTAQVRWVRREKLRVGMGMRFLTLDRDSARTLSHYVGERVPLSSAHA